MKNLLFIIFLLFTLFLKAQETTTASPPVIVAKVSLGETVVFKDVSITFTKLIEDSRCPSDVTCVWAGQAVVLATIKTETETIEKEFIFHGTSFGTERENTLFSSELKKYIAYRLSPYPISNEPIKERKYQLEVFIK